MPRINCKLAVTRDVVVIKPPSRNKIYIIKKILCPINYAEMSVELAVE